MAWMSGRSRSTTAAYSSSRTAGMLHLFSALLVQSGHSQRFLDGNSQPI